MALVAGIQAVPGRVMGHAGAHVSPGEGDALSKIKALEDAGVLMTDHPSKFGDAMKALLWPNASREFNVSIQPNDLPFQS